VGDTVIDGECFLTLLGGHRALPQSELLKAVRLERERTFEQDPKYALRLLVDIAIRALSPAVNDPTTAVQALDQITDLLRRLGSRQLRIGRIKDEHGVLRLSFPTPTWEDYLSLAFDEIRIYGATSVQVMRRLRTALYDLANEIPLERQTAVRHPYRASRSHGKSFDPRRGRSRAGASTRSARIGTFARVTKNK